MRDDAIANRLVRDDLLRLSDDCLCARLVLGSWLEEQDVIGELHSERVVCTVNAKHTVSQLFRSRTSRRLRTTCSGCASATAPAGLRGCAQPLKGIGSRTTTTNVRRERCQ